MILLGLLVFFVYIYIIIKTTKTMMVYITDAGLGYQENAYLIRLDKSANGYNYLCIGTNFDNEGSSYQEGGLVEDLEDIYVAQSGENVKNFEIYNTFLFKEFLKSKKVL